MNNVLGSWAFLIGVILAIILGAIGDISSTIAIVLFILGLIVGLLNVTDKEAQPFLVAGTVLVIVSALGSSVFELVPVIGRILDANMLIFVPATVIVALKSVFSMGKA